MLTEDQIKRLAQFVAELSPQQVAWVAGYLTHKAEMLTGGAVAVSSGAVSAAEGAVAPRKVLIYYATETNNSRGVAESLAAALRKVGFQPRAASVRDVKFDKLPDTADPVVFVSSTHGEGDPPEMAKKFFAALKDRTKAPELSKLKYAVLGLGDRSYAKFCQCAVEIDECFAARKAERFFDTRLLDVDYSAHIPAWISEILPAIQKISPAADSGPAIFVAEPAVAPAAASTIGTNRLSPVIGTIRSKVNLNDRGSNKETWHIEIDLDTPVPYEPGDALGVLLPENGNGNGHGKVEPARLYSIASSPLVEAGGVHLTVALSTHTLPDGTIGYGKCSHYLSASNPGDRIKCFISRNPRFRLPPADRDIIMIGPGTGVAPYRGFLQHRAEAGASGRNWLIFGEQHAHCDFLYQAEWQEHLANGTLHELSVAFSRDRLQKRYVQHVIREQGDKIKQWLDSGAYLYLCGRKTPMSEDVEEVLLEILNGKASSEDELSILDSWSDQGRYSKDVY